MIRLFFLFLIIFVIKVLPEESSLEDLRVELHQVKKELRELKKLVGDVPTAPKDPSSEDDIEERVTRLEELSKIGTLRTCKEYSDYGLKTSGLYSIDPDGPLIGHPPITVMCQFDENGGAATEVLHNSEESIEISHCHDAGCIQYNITYTNGPKGTAIPLSQITSLMEISSACVQTFHYGCTLAPLQADDLNLAFWTGRNGDNYYFTGSDPSLHACDCHYTEDGCMDEDFRGNTCNCDANLPIPMNDTGTLTNMTSLPMLSISFGGLSYEMQKANFAIGRLSCMGSKDYEPGTSCTALKIGGETHSGYYNIRKEGSIHTSTVYCDMSEGGYQNVPEDIQLTSDSPIGTIISWTPRSNTSSDAYQPLPEGWLPCDGTLITKGPWQGSLTPDLNTNGYFMRGSSADRSLEVEMDQVLDHQHIDSGHSHTSGSHSHSYDDKYGSNTRRGWCDGDCYVGYTASSHTSSTDSVRVGIYSSTSNIGNVTSSYRTGSENRPMNYRAVYIMKCY